MSRHSYELGHLLASIIFLILLLGSIYIIVLGFQNDIVIYPVAFLSGILIVLCVGNFIEVFWVETNHGWRRRRRWKNH